MKVTQRNLRTQNNRKIITTPNQPIETKKYPKKVSHILEHRKVKNQ
jgi:hypothetical protein